MYKHKDFMKVVEEVYMEDISWPPLFFVPSKLKNIKKNLITKE